MNEIFKELWNLNAKQTFLLVTFIIELLFLAYAFLVYCYEKNKTLKLIIFIKKNIFLLILLLTIPEILLFLVFILKDTFSLDGWFSFLGGYFGVIGAIGGIWWQLNEEKKSEIQGLLFYIKDILEDNLKNCTEKYIFETNNQAVSVLWMPNYQKIELKLKNFDLSKEDILLLYKHNYRNLIILNKKIDEIINSYKLTNEEEFILRKAEDFIKNELPESSIKQSIKQSILKIFLLILEFSNYFYYYPSSNIDKNHINKILNELNQSLIFDFFSKHTDNEIIGKFNSQINNLFIEMEDTSYEEIKNKYISSFLILYKIIIVFDINLGICLSNLFQKKLLLFKNEFYHLRISIIEELNNNNFS